jgi:hypothetical protein
MTKSGPAAATAAAGQVYSNLSPAAPSFQSSPHAGRVSAPLLDFWLKDLEFWIGHSDSAFRTANFKRSLVKYDHCVAKLSAESITARAGPQILPQYLQRSL